ncbi:hypothetical protein NEAUS03_1685 [Nematocida ausubeli]|nr:hypothetical protein NEAUS03_1685 [Nematocida ausubeli]
MSESSSLERKNYLEEEDDDDSDFDSHGRIKYSKEEDDYMDYPIILIGWEIEQGRDIANEDLKFLIEEHSSWRALEPRQRIFYIEKELSTRRREIEKRIYTQFMAITSSIEVPPKDWTEEIYHDIIEELLNCIEREQISPLVKPPKKGSRTWEEWVNIFITYVIVHNYSYSDAEKEFIKKKDVYPQELLKNWRIGSDGRDLALRNLYYTCKRLDKLSDNRSNKSTSSSRIICRKCGTEGHIAKHCRNTVSKTG